MQNLPRQLPDLDVQWLEGEAVIYHPGTTQALYLNEVCSRVFSLCDGTHSEAAMAEQLGYDGASVEHALAMLEQYGLLRPDALPRREFLRAAAWLPVILAVTAPEPAMAASASCITHPQCGTNGPANLCAPCDISSNPSFNTCDTHRCLQQWTAYNVNFSSQSGDFPDGIYICENTAVSVLYSEDCLAAKAMGAAAANAVTDPTRIPYKYRCCG